MSGRPTPNALHTSLGRPLATQVVARPTHVALPPAAPAILPTYPTLAEVEQRFLASIRFQSPRTGATYRDGMLRFDHFLAQAGVDPFTMTADDAQLPEDVLERFFGWLHESSYSRGTVETYLGGVKAFWRFATVKRLAPPRFSYDAMRAGLAMLTGKRKYRSPWIDPNLLRILTYIDNLPLPDWSERKGACRLELLRDRALLHVRSTAACAAPRWPVSTDRTCKTAGHTMRWSPARATRSATCSLAMTPCWPSGRTSRRATTTCHRCGYATTTAAADLVPVAHTGVCRSKPSGAPSGTTPAPLAYRLAPTHFDLLKASTLLNRGASLSEVQDVLGHASPVTTKQVYAQYTPKFLREAVAKYSATPAELVAELEAEQEQRRGPVA